MKNAVIALLFCTSPLVAQNQRIILPSLSIVGSTLDVSVMYDPSRHVYRYEYRITAAPRNKVPVEGFSVDVNGSTPHQQIDPDLVNNVMRRETRSIRPAVVQPATSIPVGLISPYPRGTIAGVSMVGDVVFGGFSWDVQPGTTLGGFVIESKFGPGSRTAVLIPSRKTWDDAEAKSTSEDTEFVLEEPGQTDYKVKLDSVGPAELTDADFFNGVGQQPAEVNKFIRFVQPKDNRIKVPAGVTSYYVIVYYGNTIQPATFVATLNGSDITNQFHPYPGVGDAVKIPIGPGTTKLQLEVVGTKSSGGTARDSDTLTFLPQ